MFTDPSDRPRETIDVAHWTPTQCREVWPELMAFLVDPCSAILVGSMQRLRFDPDAKAELRAKRRAMAEVEMAARTERPR